MHAVAMPTLMPQTMTVRAHPMRDARKTKVARSLNTVDAHNVKPVHFRFERSAHQVRRRDRRAR